MGDSLGSRFEALRRARFVGRREELAGFRAALDADGGTVFWVWGPGGIGKTSLLWAFASVTREAGIEPVAIDARELDGSPAAFTAAVGGRPADRRLVLLVDTTELLGSLFGWLGGMFLPSLPGDSIVVFAGRLPPPRAWRADPGWSSLLRIVPLRNFSSAEAEQFLAERGVPESARDGALRTTYGHPLGLALVGDLAEQGDLPGNGRQLPRNVVAELVDLFVEGVPSEQHRAALHLLAHARATTEDLIGEAFGTATAAELFDWLRGLSFVSDGPDGLIPHDLARDALDLDLRWRAPEGFKELHQAVRRWVLRRMEEAGSGAAMSVFLDLLFLHRHNPVMASFTTVQQAGRLYLDTARPGDRDAVLAWMRGVEGEDSAAIAAFWWDQQPEGFQIIRESDGTGVGFCAGFRFSEPVSNAVELDPVYAAAMRFIRETRPMRPGEQGWLFRFWVYPPAYQRPSPAMDLIYGWTTMLWMTTPGIAWTFVVAADAQLWQPLFAYLNFRLAGPAYDRPVGSSTYSLFAHDWRAQPFAEWLDMMAVNELSVSPGTPRPVPSAEFVVLSEQDFRAAARVALKDLRRPEGIARNPLVRSRLASGEGDSAENLIARIVAAADTLREHPRDEKLYRVVHRTYIEPTPTQEAAAELLALPWSTYRRHLTAGVERIVEALWQQELATD